MFLSCNKRINNTNTPLETVIKLQSAEECKNYAEASKYIDVVSVYSEYSKKVGLTPVQYWKEVVNISFNIGLVKIFSNSFKYYEYDILESIDDATATVEFSPIDRRGRKTRYSLHLVKNKWIVVKIQYL